MPLIDPCQTFVKNNIDLFSLVLLTSLKPARCSLVIDSASQKGIYVSDYCPSMQYCREGAHVMCMYYNANRVMGPHCYNAVNITMSPSLANQLLDVMNAIRSKIANGKETGKDDILLPRGYGIFRLKWDSELATFAQVLANQCLLRHDMCRATKRFPNPGQIVGLVRFTFPDWYLLHQPKGTPTPGLTDAKLVYAITHALKTWYAQKTSVTEQMLKSQPDWNQPSTSQAGRLYFEMIFGSTTHIGCGMSAYAEYNAKSQNTYNSIQLVCNYSSRPRKGGSSYNTEPPLPGLGYSPQCGCPPGTFEDADCLCNELVESTPPRAHEATCPDGETKGNCEPTLVLLPIFTMEDAPPEKLIEQAESIRDPLKNFILQRIDNGTSYPRSKMSLELADMFDDADREVIAAAVLYTSSIYRAPIPPPIFPKNVPDEPPAPPPRIPPRPAPRLSPQLPRAPMVPARPAPPPPPPARPPPDPPSPPPPPPRIPPPTPPPVVPPALDQINELIKAHNDLLEKEQSVKRRPTPKPQPKRPLTKKSSIFTRVAQFKLPGRKSMPSPFEVAKKDVPPRKDFSNLPKVVNDYLSRRSEFRRNSIEDKQNVDENHDIEEKKRYNTKLTDEIKQHIANKKLDEFKKRDDSPQPDEIKQRAEEKQRDDNQYEEIEHDEAKQQLEDSQRVEHKRDAKQHEDRQEKQRVEPKQEEESKQQQQNKPKETEAHTDAPVTETRLKKAEEKVINFNQYLREKDNNTKINTNNKDIDVKDDIDNKLMSLLDTLEKEVKHVALAGNEKEIFDAKIRKIYGTVVGDPVDLTTLKPIETNLGELKKPQHEPSIIKIPEENPQTQIRQIRNQESSLRGSPVLPLNSVMMQQSSPLAHNVIYRAPIPPPIFPKNVPDEPPAPPPRIPPRPAPRLSPQLPRAPMVPARPAPPPPPPARPPPDPPSPPPPPPRIPPPTPPPVVPPALDQINELIKAHNDLLEKEQSVKRRPTPKPQPKRPLTKKSSIFTRVAQFKLPGRKSMPSPFEVAKKDVPPRKDFSNLPKVVNDYLSRRSEFRRNSIEDKQNVDENHDIEEKKRYNTKLTDEIKQHIANKKLDEFKKRDDSPQPDEIKQRAEEKQRDDNQYEEIEHDEAKQQLEDSQRVEHKRDAKQHEDRQEKQRVEPKQEEESKQQQQNKPKETEAHTDAPVTETRLKKAEEKVINFNQYLREKDNNTKINTNNKDIDVKDDIDNKLMSLLDTLEKEVKHVALAGNEKEIFDAKIRKIYGTVVGDPVDLTTLKPIETNLGELKKPQHEPSIIKIPEENPQTQIRQIRNQEVEGKSGRNKNYEYLVQRKDKLIENYNQNKYIENIDANVFSDVEKKRDDAYDRKYNERYEQRYRNGEHKYMDDIDRKYSENLDRKYNENNLDHGKFDIRHKYVDNLNQKYHYTVDQKYDDNVTPAHRNQIKYDPKDVVEFREFKNNALTSAEENNIKYRNYDKFEKDIKPQGIIDRNLLRNKDERKHRIRDDGRRIKSVHAHNDLEDPLSLERRKYYQEKLDNIERKLRGTRNNRHRNDQVRNERPMRRMRPSRDGIQRTRSKSQTDFYMPERARFLHGF
uniref:SCP domain-containing protein n=1 Tax=Heliothis virescens TaxID=7102 RepID=A0A2A4JY44_HELVI